MQEILDSLLALEPASRLEHRADGYWIDVPEMDTIAMARCMVRGQVHLSTVTAFARADGETDLIYHYRLGGVAINIKARTHGGAIDSIANDCLAANWIEREIHDLYAVTFNGHPNPAHLILPPGMQEGIFRELGGRLPNKS